MGGWVGRWDYVAVCGVLEVAPHPLTFPDGIGWIPGLVTKALAYGLLPGPALGSDGCCNCCVVHDHVSGVLQVQHSYLNAASLRSSLDPC